MMTWSGLVDYALAWGGVHSDMSVTAQGELPARGGEAAALAWLQHCLWGWDTACAYADTRYGVLGGNLLDQFPPWAQLTMIL